MPNRARTAEGVGHDIEAGGEMPGNLSGLLVTDASGAPLQNPALQLDEMSRHVEYRYFYF